MNRTRNRTDRALRALLGIVGLGLAACGSDGSEVAEDSALTVAITDAASDEVSSFVLDITAIQLTKVGGNVVGALPQTVSVDLISLEEVSQVLNVLNLTPGLYTSAAITFDFASAAAYLVGEATPAAIVDADGNALDGEVTLPVTIGNSLLAVAGRHKVLELDFDLDQSITVDAASNTVAVEPAIVVRVDPSNPKDLFLGGELLSVTAADSTFDLELQTIGGVPVREVEVLIEDTTVYHVDGVPFVGAAGLAALETAGAGTWVQAYGAVDLVRARICASYVEAGTGTINGGTDIVEGQVLSRGGGAGADSVWTVRGHGQNAAHTSFQFNTDFTVSASFANTKVVRRGVSEAGDTDDVNVGQRVRIFGALAGTSIDVQSPTGVVRLQPTRVFGFANAEPSAGELSLGLERVGLRNESLFTWSDGGTTPAVPSALIADVGNLANDLGIGMSTAIKAVGFFNAVDDDGADFSATSLVNRELGPSLLLVVDRPAGFTLTPTVSAEGVTLAISGTKGLFEVALIDRGFVGATPLPTDPEPRVLPTGAPGFYVINDKSTGSVALHLEFADFAADLDAKLAGGASLFRFSSTGIYDAAANSVSAALANAVLK